MPLERALILLLIGIGATSGIALPAFAVTCMELSNCPTNVGIFEYWAIPYTQLLGDWIKVIVWGAVIGVLYIRTGNAMMASMVGLLIASVLTGTTLYGGGTTNTPFFWGYVMVAVSFGSTVFILLRSRAQNP